MGFVESKAVEQLESELKMMQADRDFYKDEYRKYLDKYYGRLNDDVEKTTIAIKQCNEKAKDVIDVIEDMKSDRKNFMTEWRKEIDEYKTNNADREARRKKQRFINDIKMKISIMLIGVMLFGVVYGYGREIKSIQQIEYKNDEVAAK